MMGEGAYLDHAFRCLCMGTAGRCRVDLLTRNRPEKLDELGAQCILDRVIVFRWDLRGWRDRGRKLHLAYRRDERDNLDTVRELEVLFRNRASGNSAWGCVNQSRRTPAHAKRTILTYRLTRAAPSTTAARLHAILL